MVEVVSSARDAEKAMEKARIEASRAEVSYSRCMKELGAVEVVVGKIMAALQFDAETGKDGAKMEVKEV